MEIRKDIAVKKLAGIRPDITRKLFKLNKLRENGYFSNNDIQEVGLSNDELKVLQSYGIIKEWCEKEVSNKTN